MAYQLPKLKYSQSALAPFLTQETFEFHYGKHHKAYIDNLNKLMAGTPFAEKNLDEIVKTSSGGIFNNAAQVWNHAFYWECMTDKPAALSGTTALNGAITKTFGSLDKLKEEFVKSAIGNFGSGWTWLCKTDSGDLKIVNTSNAECPIKENLKPLFTVDVWEHAYYIDYRNARQKYVETFWNHIDWDYASGLYDSKSSANIHDLVKA